MTHTTLDTLTAILAWAEEQLGVVIDRTNPNGSFRYHLHDAAGCHRDAAVSGFPDVASALTAGMQAAIDRSNERVLQPYLAIMDALDAAGVTIGLDRNMQFQYSLASGAGQGGFVSEAAAIRAAMQAAGLRPAAALAMVA